MNQRWWYNLIYNEWPTDTAKVEGLNVKCLSEHAAHKSWEMTLHLALDHAHEGQNITHRKNIISFIIELLYACQWMWVHLACFTQPLLQPVYLFLTALDLLYPHPPSLSLSPSIILILIPLRLTLSTASSIPILQLSISSWPTFPSFLSCLHLIVTYHMT